MIVFTLFCCLFVGSVLTKPVVKALDESLDVNASLIVVEDKSEELIDFNFSGDAGKGPNSEEVEFTESDGNETAEERTSHHHYRDQYYESWAQDYGQVGGGNPGFYGGYYGYGTGGGGYGRLPPPMGGGGSPYGMMSYGSPAMGYQSGMSPYGGGGGMYAGPMPPAYGGPIHGSMTRNYMGGGYGYGGRGYNYGSF